MRNTNVASSVELEVGMQELELDMQELEGLEAPDFWGGFSVGVTISGVGVGAYVSLAAASVVIT
ncbi:hypothetical protein GCM10010430_02670 [Kitasatospora cystarginea]|uniref:Class IIb bacteriocin, lactobin A/cerein 7B family n=1 Tax=Kitasatospora cystarginea TaxID=58350 RepID=A0ABN3DBV0_9ACTN